MSTHKDAIATVEQIGLLMGDNYDDEIETLEYAMQYLTAEEQEQLRNAVDTYEEEIDVMQCFSISQQATKRFKEGA